MRSWLPLLAVVAALACLLPLVALNGIPPLLTTAESTRRRPLAPAGLSRQALVETVSSVAQRLELHPLEMDGVSHVLGMLDAVRTTVAAVPEVAKATSSVAASLNGTRNEQAKTSARLDAAFESIQRLSLQIAALQEPWVGHGGEVRCASGHRCASYIDAGKTNLTALMSVTACRDHCTRAFPATNFFAFHNEYGWVAFMLDPKGRCRCFDASPCELVPDGGYNLWTSAERCTLDLLPPSERTTAAAEQLGLAGGQRPADASQTGIGGGASVPVT